MTYLPNTTPGFTLPPILHSFTVYSSIQQYLHQLTLSIRNKALIPQMSEFLRAFYWYNMSKIGRAIFYLVMFRFSLFHIFQCFIVFPWDNHHSFSFLYINNLKRKRTLVTIATKRLTAHLSHKNLQKASLIRIHQVFQKKKMLKTFKAKE